MRKTKKINKKGYLEDWLPAILACIVIVLIILFFAFKKSGPIVAANKINLEQKEIIDAKINLNAFLASHVEGNTNVDTISELIARSYLDKDYSFLEKQVFDHFNRYYEKDSSWQIELTVLSTNEIFSTDAMQGEGAKICNNFLESWALNYGTQNNARGAASCSARTVLASALIPYYKDDNVDMIRVDLISYTLYIPSK